MKKEEELEVKWSNKKKIWIIFVLVLILVGIILFFVDIR